MLTCHNTKMEVERERERKFCYKKLDWYLLDFLVTRNFNSVPKITVFFDLLFCHFSVMLKPFIFNFSFSENYITCKNLKLKFSNQINLIIFDNFKGI